MQDLTDLEFRERLTDLHRARKIFIESGLTKNLSIAFEAYQALISDKKKADRLNTYDHKSPAALLFQKYPRPTCPECGSPLKFREVPKNEKGIKTQLVCMRDHPSSVLNSPLGLAEWQSLLSPEKMESTQKIVNALLRVSRTAPLPGKIEGLEAQTCPECGFQALYKINACCGAPNGYLWCERCQYEKILD